MACPNDTLAFIPSVPPPVPTNLVRLAAFRPTTESGGPRNKFFLNGTWTYAGYTYVHDLTWEILEGLSFVKWDGEEELDTLSQ